MSAFPHIDPVARDGVGQCYEGLTKREWYAGMALQGICAGMNFKGDFWPIHPKELTSMANVLADAMLAAAPDHG